MFLQTGAEFPWLPVGARVRFEQLHTMVDSRSAGKEEQRWTERRLSLFKSDRRQRNKKKKGNKKVETNVSISVREDTHMMGGLYQ